MQANFGTYGRFELYSIEIEKLNGDLKTIISQNSLWEETLYAHEEVPITKSLSLKGPKRPCSPLDPIYIRFCVPNDDWNWYFRIYSEEEEGRKLSGCTQKVLVVDPRSDSRALITYALFPVAVDAELELSYEGDQNLQIFQGEISATTQGDEATKRVLWSLNPDPTTETTLKSPFFVKKNRRPEPYELRPAGVIDLFRSVLGVPLKTFLQVTLDLEYCLVPTTKTRKSTEKKTPFQMGHIKEKFDFYVPDSPWDSPPGVVFLSSDHGDRAPKLIFKVKWTDGLRNIFWECRTVFKPDEDDWDDALTEMIQDASNHREAENASNLQDGENTSNLQEVENTSNFRDKENVKVSTDAMALDFSGLPTVDYGWRDYRLKDYSFNFEELKDPNVRVQVAGNFIRRTPRKPQFC